MKKSLFILPFVLLAACAPKGGASETATSETDMVAVTDSVVADERGYIVSVGDIAPDFVTVKAADGDTVQLSDYRGRVVMLQFTASWCGVCRKEMPDIESRIWQRHKENASFALLGIDRDEPAETVMEFAKKTGVTYPLVLDPDADIFGLYADKRAGVTRNVIVGRDGRIVMMTRLYDEVEFDRMVCVIDSLLAVPQ